MNIETVITLLGALSIVIVIARKFKPEVDTYLSVTRPVLEEVDDIIDLAAEEFPENRVIANINRVVDKVIAELEEAGYKIDDADKRKIELRTKAKLNREVGK